MKIMDVSKTLCIQHNTRSWCLLPYPGHPNGCPNYGVADKCPPKVCTVEKFINLSAPMFFIVAEFNLKIHAEKMIRLHPTWSEKQAKCCLYWQNSVRKQLIEECEIFTKVLTNYVYTLIPEAMGVNVFRTAHRHGLMLRKNPDIVYKIALLGQGV